MQLIHKPIHKIFHLKCEVGHGYAVPDDSVIAIRAKARILIAIKTDECLDCLQDELHQRKCDARFYADAGDDEDVNIVVEDLRRVEGLIRKTEPLYTSESNNRFQRLM